MPEVKRRVPDHLRRTVPRTIWLTPQEDQELVAEAEDQVKPVTIIIREAIIGRRKVKVFHRPEAPQA